MSIVNVSNIVWLEEQPDNSIDHIITDPPYLINFMGKDWDKKNSPAGNPDFWKECLRVVKPGGYCLAFGHSRQHHRVMAALEDGGWDVRDCLMWLYGQGFPKSHEMGIKLDKHFGKAKNRGVAVKHHRGQEALEKPQRMGKHEPITEEAKRWSGWGNALKPAYEPIIMARKPYKGSLVKNVLEWDVGALNIDACRVGTEEGRFPANVMLDEEAGDLLGDTSRFFYCAKVSKKERNLGCNDLPDAKWTHPKLGGSVAEDGVSNKIKGRGTVAGVSKNNHPTVKPVALMEWLVKLVSQEGHTILDPFAGSGSTGMACVNLDREFIGLELDPDYAKIAKRRIEYVKCSKKSN